MKEIKIWFCDFWPNFNKDDNYIINILKKHYIIKLEKHIPDYIFYSNFGYNFLKFKGIKIWCNGENVFPNFNLCDYAISCHDIKIDNNRYFKLPVYMLKGNNLIEEKDKIVKENDLKNKNKFCNFIYDNKKGDIFRKVFFTELSKYKKVDSAGKFLNNTGFVTNKKLELQKQYKFTIAFENESYYGYCTEKIMDAFFSKTIPIYWGDPYIENDINSKAFINIKSKNNIKEVIDQIKEIDNNDSLWLDILNQPIFTKSHFIQNKKKDLENFLLQLIENGKKQVPNSIEAKRVSFIVNHGNKIINLKHKLHKIKVEKWI